MYSHRKKKFEECPYLICFWHTELQTLTAALLCLPQISTLDGIPARLVETFKNLQEMILMPGKEPNVSVNLR